MIKVFIIDDSLMVRNGIVSILKSSNEIQIIGEAANPVDAIPIFKKVGFPDVFILDIEMPKMDGLTFLKKINEQNPTPVIICSTLVSLGSTAAIDALRLGAVEIVLKPMVGVKNFFQEQKEEFITAIKSAARSKLLKSKTTLYEKKPSPSDSIKLEYTPSKSFISIGSSTGGVQVLEEVLINLKPNHKGIIITQHMPEGFTASFAKRLDSLLPSQVVESSNGETICDNKIIIAKGGIHTEIYNDNGVYKTKLKDFPRVNSHKPSINVLFKSISKSIQDDLIAFILTGMGNDGASEIKKLHDMGYKTYGQNEESCTIYGMSKAAKELGGIDEEINIHQIIEKINNF